MTILPGVHVTTRNQMFQMTGAIMLAGIFGVFCSAQSMAGTTGSLKGKVTDVKTGEVLPGVNVLVVGSGRGAVTSVTGEYNVPGITAGVYAVRASLLGYKSIDVSRITIDADETAVYNFKLASEDIELEGVTVEGRPPLVDTKKLAGDQTFNRNKIEQLPNVKGVEDVLAVQAGVTRFGGQLFLRGGRANETQIVIDGVVVNDNSGSSSTNQELRNLYSGNTTGGAGGALSVSANAIQSVSVQTGGLDVEYGNAQSGVVSITTKSGGDTYSGAAQYRTDGITNQGFGERYYAANAGGPEPITRFLLPALGITLPGKINFFASGSFNQADGPYQFSQNSFYHPVRRSIRFTGFLGDLLNGVGLTYDEKQTNDFLFNGKLTYYISDNDQVSYSYRANAKTRHQLTDAFGFRDRYDSSSAVISLQTHNVLQWKHFFGENSEIMAYISRLSSDRTTAIGNLSPAAYSPSFVGINGGTDPNSDGIVDLSTSQLWEHSLNETWNMKAMIDARVHELHRVKAGIEYFAEGLRGTSISRPGERWAGADTNSRGEYPASGFGRWVTNNYPGRGALFVQDYIELEKTLTIKIGLRYDFLYLGKQVFNPEFVQNWENAVNAGRTPESTPISADWLGYESFLSQATRGYFSPRFAIGYPVSQFTVFYFNYTHYLQFPDWDQYFHDPISKSIPNNRVGNPSLKPQKTIQYEAGFDQEVITGLKVGVRGFYKDVFDYPQARSVQGVSPSISRFINYDYASTRGVEVILVREGDDGFSGNISYTFQLTKGRADDPFAELNSPAALGLPREVRLAWDQEHIINVYALYRVGPRDDFSVFGIPLNNWGASITWSYGSGFPFTPYVAGTSTITSQYYKNTGDGPYTSEVNLHLDKGVELFGNLNLSITLDINNLFNRRNPDLSWGVGFNTLFGRTIEYGDYNPADPLIYSWGTDGLAFQSTVPPFSFQRPRQISLGMRISWD